MATNPERVRPITSTELQRQYHEAHALPDEQLHAQELHTTSDELRLFRHHALLGPVDHGTVASEIAMEAIWLQPSCTRGVWPGDTCYRSDLGVEMRCISGHHATAVWRAVATAGGGGGDPTEAIAAAISTHDGSGTSHSDLRTLISGKQATLSNATTLAKITETGGAPLWDGGAWPLGTGVGDAWDIDTPPTTDTTFTWASNGDTNGLCYYIGTARGTMSWANPTTRGVTGMGVLRSSNGGGTPEQLVNRVASESIYTNNEANAWLAFDFIDLPIKPAKYSLKSRQSYAGYIRNWKLQGTNTISAWTVAGVNGASWTDLDTHTADTTINAMDTWGTFTMTPPSNAYRYLRILQTGAQSDSTQYLTTQEVEFYGVVAVGRLLPAGAVGWMTNGTLWAPYY